MRQQASAGACGNDRDNDRIAGLGGHLPAVDGDSDGCRGVSGDLYVDGVGAVDVTPDSDADVARTDVEQAALQVKRLREGGSGRLTSHRSPRKAAFERAFMSKQEEKVNILIRFRIFYLCNGRSIIRQL